MAIIEVHAHGLRDTSFGRPWLAGSDKVLLTLAALCFCTAAFLYGFVTQPAPPLTAQIHAPITSQPHVH